MKMKRLLLLTYFLLIVNALFCLPYDMIPTDDPILNDLLFLSLETGKPFLSFSPPLAPDEVGLFLDSIDANSLSQPAAEAYYRVLQRLDPKTHLSLSFENFAVFLNINAELKGRVRLNNEISWENEYSKITPLFSFPLRLFFSDLFQLYIEPEIAMKPDAINDINIPMDMSAQYWPMRAFLALGGSWWNFQLGRDRFFWGTAHTGSLSFSDSSLFFDYARISFFSKYIKYSVIVNQLPLELDDKLFLPEGETGHPTDWKDPDKYYLTSTTQRHFYLHRLDINLFDRVTIGLMEGLMAGNSPLELRYLNPLMLFHSIYSWKDYKYWGEDGSMNGSFFSVEINWNITKPLAFYAQFVMNQFALPGELEGSDDQPPDALGYIAGFHFTRSFGKWGSVFFLEFVYTDPYLYILSSPFSSFIMTNWDYYFIGYPRDTIALTLGAKFFNGDALSFSADFSWVSKGEHNKNGVIWDWIRAGRGESTPHGTAENRFIFSVGSQWKPFSYLTLKAAISGIVSLNNGHNSDLNETGGQASVSVSFHY